MNKNIQNCETDNPDLTSLPNIGQEMKKQLLAVFFRK